MKTKKFYGKIAALVILLAAGCGLFYYQVSQAREPDKEVWGIADAKESMVHSKVSGRVVHLYVKEGDLVEKGQLLAKIDQDVQNTDRMQAEASLRAQYAQLQQSIIQADTDRQTLESAVSTAEAASSQARTALDLAEKNEGRYSRLLSQGAISAQQYDNARAARDNARAAYDASLSQLDSARAGLLKNKANDQVVDAQKQQLDVLKGKLDAVAINENETEIRAPFAGMITQKYVEEGTLISPDISLFSLQDLKDNWVHFKVKETDLPLYHVGQEVHLTGRNKDISISGHIESINRKPDYAVIRATNERGDRDMVTFDVKVRTNADNVWPGMRFYLKQE